LDFVHLVNLYSITCHLAMSILQVQYNLFTAQTVSPDKEGFHRTTKYFACREVEENFRRNLQSSETTEGFWQL